MSRERTGSSRVYEAGALAFLAVGAYSAAKGLGVYGDLDFRSALKYWGKAVVLFGAGMILNTLRNIEDEQTGVSTGRKATIPVAESSRLYRKYYSDPKNSVPIQSVAASFNAARLPEG